jgi:hypothetical protein
MTQRRVRWATCVVNCAILVGTGRRAGRAETVLWEERSQNAASRVILVSESAFSEKLVVEICRRVLQKSTPTFMHLAVVTDHQHRFDLAGASHVPLEVWIKNCGLAATSVVRVAEMTKVGGDVVVRIRAGRNVRRIILDGKDPLKYRISTSGFDIVHIGLNRSGIFQFVIYARSEGRLTLPNVEGLYRQLQRRLPSTAVYFVAREDAWFYKGGRIASCWWAVAPPGDQRVLEASPEMTCAQYQPNGPVCIGR